MAADTICPSLPCSMHSSMVLETTISVVNAKAQEEVANLPNKAFLFL